MSNELVQIEQLNIAELFSGKGIDSLVADIKAKAMPEKEVDLSKKVGRDELKSLAYKVTRSKTALEKAGKDLIAEMDNKVKSVKAVSKTISSQLDAIAEEIKAPALEFEAKEEARVKAHQSTVAHIKAFQITTENKPDKLQLKLDELNQINIDSLEEFKEVAKREFETSSMVLKQKIQDAIKYEEDQKELAELRRQKFEQDEKDRKAKEEQDRIDNEKKSKEIEAQREKQKEIDIQNALKEKQRQEDEAAKKREQDHLHKKRINNEALQALVKEAKLSEETAKLVVEAVAKGLVPNVVIRY